MKDILEYNWKRIDLSHHTDGRRVFADWKQSVPGRMTEFLRFTVEVDEVIKIISGELLQMKIYETGGGRNSPGLSRFDHRSSEERYPTEGDCRV